MRIMIITICLCCLIFSGCETGQGRARRIRKEHPTYHEVLVIDATGEWPSKRVARVKVP